MNSNATEVKTTKFYTHQNPNEGNCYERQKFFDVSEKIKEFGVKKRPNGTLLGLIDFAYASLLSIKKLLSKFKELSNEEKKEIAKLRGIINRIKTTEYDEAGGYIIYLHDSEEGPVIRVDKNPVIKREPPFKTKKLEDEEFTSLTEKDMIEEPEINLRG